MSDDEEDVEILDFSQQQALACADGWLQSRYYAEDGARVMDVLSFDRVFDLCPFEVGASRRAQRREFAGRLAWMVGLMELRGLMRRPFNTLSNGEMRRVLFARAVLRNPRRLILDDPMAGLDPQRCERMKRIIRELLRSGVKLEVRYRNGDESVLAASEQPEADRPAPCGGSGRVAGPLSGAKPVVELKDITIRHGRRRLFDRFSWTVRKGERWVLRGPNGSGKTTLFALITGDSPLAYANDVRVFGVPRAPGHDLGAVRRRIASVSPEMQTYLRKAPDELVEEALASEPDLLLLDEPCLNLGAKDARRLLKRVSDWLSARPDVTAICIAHRRDHIPPGFDCLMSIGE